MLRNKIISSLRQSNKAVQLNISVATVPVWSLWHLRVKVKTLHKTKMLIVKWIFNYLTIIQNKNSLWVPELNTFRKMPDVIVFLNKFVILIQTWNLFLLICLWILNTVAISSRNVSFIRSRPFATCVDHLF